MSTIESTHAARVDRMARLWPVAPPRIGIQPTLKRAAGPSGNQRTTGNLPLSTIAKTVAEFAGIDVASLLGGRGARFSRPRHMFLWLARKHSKASTSTIARYCGMTDHHSTVLYAAKKINTKFSLYSRELAEIEKMMGCAS